MLKKYDLGTSATVVKNKYLLREKDIFDSAEGVLSLQDPVFELWLRKIFFNEDYT